MLQLLSRGSYNSGKRPSQHDISKNGFLKKHAGAIAPNLIEVANTGNGSPYQSFCKQHEVEPHPARMPEKVADFFIRFLTTKGDLVLDPFSGSNTTGTVANRLERRWLSIEAVPHYAVAGVANFNPARAEPCSRNSQLLKAKEPFNDQPAQTVATLAGTCAAGMAQQR
jgi:DNA modification methylase